MILAAAHPQCVHRMVVWGANATVTAEDVKLYEAIRDTSKWSPKMREPLEGEECCFLNTSDCTKHGDAIKEMYLHKDGRPHNQIILANTL